MDAKEFERITAQTRMSEQTKTYARRVMVDGWSLGKTATYYDVSKQLVSAARQRVLRHKAKADGNPEEWERVTVELPPDLAKLVKWLYHENRYQVKATITAPTPPPRLKGASVSQIVEALKAQ